MSEVHAGVIESIKRIERKIDSLADRVKSPAPEAGGGLTSSGGAKPKRTRTKSAYNIHMSQQLAELKTLHPDVGHRERFAMAVKSWKKGSGKPEDAEEKSVVDESPDPDLGSSKST